MALDITIEYKHIGHSEWIQIAVPPEEYFDDDEDITDIDAVPRYDHSIEYLNDVQKPTLEATRLTVKDNLQGKTLTITERFWNNGENRVIERRDSSGEEEIYWEMIIDVVVSKTPPKSECLRIGRDSGIVQVFLHTFIEQLPDGSEREEIIYPVRETRILTAELEG
jgi:hypothetical protein